MPVTINGSNTPTAGGVTYGDGTQYATTSAGTSGQVLTSAGSSAPTWSTPAGGFSAMSVITSSSTFTIPSGKTTLKVTVEDTGMGIPEDIKEFIFDKFFRGPRGDSMATGLGLGLNNVRQWLKDLTGELHLQSKEKVGSKFTVLLPMQLPLLDNYDGIV